MPPIPTAIFFPGQASEAPAMLAPILRRFPSIARDGIDAISQALPDDPDLPTIIDLLNGSSADNDKRLLLQRTAIAQPCNLLAAILTYRVILQSPWWMAHCASNPTTTVYFGHSLGQITAFTAAGAIPLVDAIKIVRERGLAMEQVMADFDISAVSKYGMLAVPIKNNTTTSEFIAKVRDAAKKLPSSVIVDCANFNSPTQVVLSGQVTALDKIATELGLGRKSKYLPVRIPFHSRLLRPVEGRVRAAVDSASVTMPPSALHFLRNSDANPITTSQDMRDAIVTGCWEPVDWVRSVRTVQQQFGVKRWIGIGPGSAITTTLVERSLLPSASDHHDIIAFDPIKPGSGWDVISG
ncbi:acyl transferase/acyl hydrolase/lysophospholipase [Lipomyces kononenkoae]